MVSKYDLGQEWQGRALLYEFRLRLEQECQKHFNRWKGLLVIILCGKNGFWHFQQDFLLSRASSVFNNTLDEMLIIFWKGTWEPCLKTKSKPFRLLLTKELFRIWNNLKLNLFAPSCQTLHSAAYFKSVPQLPICGCACDIVFNSLKEIALRVLKFDSQSLWNAIERNNIP